MGVSPREFSPQSLYFFFFAIERRATEQHVAEQGHIMEVVYIRHHWPGFHTVLDELWKRKWIAVYYEENRSTKPEDYGEAGRRTLALLHECCQKGAIIAADFRAIRPGAMLIGKVTKGSKIRPWRFHHATSGVTRTYKILPLSRTQEISFACAPLLGASRPQQGTCCRWHVGKAYVQAIVNKCPMPWTVQSLAPSQLEVICHEYLRITDRLAALLLPIGRGLSDVDIVGVGGARRVVLAQVTHESSPRTVAEKLSSLMAFGESRVQRYFFGPKTARVEKNGVTYVSIEEVFKKLTDDRRSVTFKMINRMLQPFE